MTAIMTGCPVRPIQASRGTAISCEGWGWMGSKLHSIKLSELAG